jgi:DNA-binding transcriptional ArsR family regulator
MARSHANGAHFRRVLHQFGLFGHPIRVVIFQRLARTPATAGELASEIPITRAAVVQHLKRLESAGLVEALTDGRRRVYRIRAGGLAPLARWIEEHSV